MDDTLSHAATYRVNKSVPTFGRHYDQIGFLSGIENGFHDIALTAEFRC